MKNAILATITNRGATRLTRKMWGAWVRAGVLHLEMEGSPDVAFARNAVLSAACDMARKMPERDVIILCDDDMIAPLDALQELCDAARRHARAVSAIYATSSGTLAGCRWRGADGEIVRDAEGRTLWLVGLGLAVIPTALLLQQEARLPKYPYKETQQTAFCQSGIIDGQWIAEDYQLSRNLGGVRLEPIAVGHVKSMPIWPDQETVDAVGADEILPGEDADIQNVKHADTLYAGDAPFQGEVIQQREAGA